MFLVILLTACLYKKRDISVNNGPWVRVYVFLENKSILKYLPSLCNPADNGMSKGFSTSVHTFPKVRTQNLGKQPLSNFAIFTGSYER